MTTPSSQALTGLGIITKTVNKFTHTWLFIVLFLRNVYSLEAEQLSTISQLRPTMLSTLSHRDFHTNECTYLLQSVPQTVVTYGHQTDACEISKILMHIEPMVSTVPVITEDNSFVSGLAVPLTLKTISGLVSFHLNLVPLTVTPLTTETSKNFLKSSDCLEDAWQVDRRNYDLVMLNVVKLFSKAENIKLSALFEGFYSKKN